MGSAETEEADGPPLPSWGTFDYGAGLREVATLKAIEEFLAYSQLREAQDAFHADIDRVGLKHTPSGASSTAARDVEEVLSDFDAGRREAFESAWARVMPEETRRSRDGRALELRLRAHFATLRARRSLEAGAEPSDAELKEDMAPFKVFLEQHGLDELGGDESLVPLFAMPFVRRPHAQQDVGEVFTARWLSALRIDLEAALRRQLPPAPVLYDLVEMPPVGAAGEGAWQAVWSQLFRLADGALDLGALAAAGATVPQAPLAEGRRQLEALREQVPGGLELRLSYGPSTLNASPSRGVRSRAATAPPRMPRDIDFRRLGEFIASRAALRRRGSPNEDDESPVGGGAELANGPSLEAVLRALLQRLASAESPPSLKRGFLVSIACFDVLDVNSGAPGTLPALLSDPAVAELTLGILAVLACEAVGRTYVVSDLECVRKVVELLVVQPLDSSLHIQALAALQRLSLRRAPQDLMIQMGVVEWVVGVLSKWQEEAIQGMPSEFSLEFGSAMLMNLALRTEGKRKCAALDVLTVALNLMEHWNSQIRTHINGTLYSLLSNQPFRERARGAGLESVLRSIHSHAASLGDELSRRQIEYLLEQLNPETHAASANDAGAESGEEDEDDDENFIEEEELASVLLGDRSGQSAAEALRVFAASPALAEAQQREFRTFLAANTRQRC
eukprot:TRINITY_DN3120_c0_g4_i1.p1 TRINITY_DN3120_c0_g4~~TRINITY_DN3120_c0_g4_i1.p1  ORF type:complete len:693 (-),score=158.71 TRINITY_DN3120_c0_g4_i1:23-2056(-)